GGSRPVWTHVRWYSQLGVDWSIAIRHQSWLLNVLPTTTATPSLSLKSPPSPFDDGRPDMSYAAMFARQLASPYVLRTASSSILCAPAKHLEIGSAHV